MFRSMTAYGRALVSSPICEIALELISLNRKHLDIRFALPSELSRFEPFLRSLFEGKVERGTIQVKFQVQWKEELPVDIYPNFPLIKKFIDIRKQVENKYGTQSDPTGLMNWVFEREGSLVTVENEAKDQEIKALLTEAFEKAFVPFLDMKKKEGVAIYQDVFKRVLILETNLKEIEKNAPNATLKYREKISKILSEYCVTPEDKERVIKEAAIFADRVDITEEITRFKSHLVQLNQLANSNDPFIGKTVDFLLQELMREVNTMGNKAQDHQISVKVVVMKAELEKIREQIQNVE